MKILLVVYDNDAYIHHFPLGVAYIASYLRDKHQVDIYHQDIEHTSEDHLTTTIDNGNYDVVGVGVVAGYYQYRKLMSISSAISRCKRKPIYIIAGHGPTPEPAYFMKKTGADYCIMGEGEYTIVDLLKCIRSNGNISTVSGIAYRINGDVTVNPRRSVISNIDSILYPSWDLFDIDYYGLYRYPNIKISERSMPVLSARGCPYSCNFCYRMDPGVRVRDDDSILDEIKYLYDNYNIRYIAFVDELLMISPSRTIELCKSIIDSGLNIHWYCNGRLNHADTTTLRYMKDAGCVFINYGIESVDDRVLSLMNKHLTKKIITDGIVNTIDAGISPGFNVIFGNIGDTKESLWKSVEFLLRYDDHSQLRTIRPVTPYPGSALYYYAIERNMLGGVEDFYENKHTNSDLLSVNFTDMSDDEFYTELCSANKILIENYYQYKLNSMIGVTENLYMNRDSTFRGYRHT